MRKKANNISSMLYCYGCSTCSVVCPKSIIRLKLNKVGFYQPVLVDEVSCIQCGLCVNVCSFYNNQMETDINSVRGFATWSKDASVRRKASSGGAGFEIARTLLGKGYKVIAVRYNAELQQAEHYIAESESDLIQSMGSKYIQSYPEKAFHSMKKGYKYLVTGTPCQIASLRRYIKMKKMENDVILMDFFCHGVPSKLLWDKYISELMPKTEEVISVSWRNKQTGWHDSYAITINGLKKDYIKRRSDGDLETVLN